MSTRSIHRVICKCFLSNRGFAALVISNAILLPQSDREALDMNSRDCLFCTPGRCVLWVLVFRSVAAFSNNISKVVLVYEISQFPSSRSFFGGLATFRRSGTVEISTRALDLATKLATREWFFPFKFGLFARCCCQLWNLKLFPLTNPSDVWLLIFGFSAALNFLKTSLRTSPSASRDSIVLTMRKLGRRGKVCSTAKSKIRLIE